MILYISFRSTNDKLTTIVWYSFDKLLKSRASYDGRMAFCGCLTTFWRFLRLSLSCRAKSWTFFSRTLHDTYFCCTLTPQLPCFLLWRLRFRQQTGCYWPSSGSRTTKTPTVWCEQGLRWPKRYYMYSWIYITKKNIVEYKRFRLNPV